MDKPVTSNQERIRGYIQRVSFQNTETGFCVLQIKIKEKLDLCTVVGISGPCYAGEYVQCDGEWVSNRSYGLQFKAEKIVTTPPTSLAGIERYLGSGLIKGLGPHYAKILVDAFGEKVLEVIDNSPEQLLNLSGIGQKRLQMVIDSWKEQKSVREIIIFLHEHGVGTARAVRIYKTYGDEAIARITANPYCLANDIHGIGFKTADALALKLGIDKHSPLRIAAAVRHVVQEHVSDAGDCAILKPALLEKAGELLEVEADKIEAGLWEELAEKRLIQSEINGEVCIYPSSLFFAEKSVAEHIIRLKGKVLPWGDIPIEKAIIWVEQKTGLKLSASQHEAVQNALENKVFIITGGPGVGKTTIVNSVLKIIRTRPIRLCLCAPTGRAAKRLSESTGMSAMTIHRLLGFDAITRQIKHNEDNPLNCDLLVVDEASMIDIVLMNHLLKALPTQAGLLIVGDVDQLPSVGPGAVLADLIDSGIIPVARLQEIFRQAATSKIITSAHSVNRGYLPDYKNPPADSDFYFIPADTPEEIVEKLLYVCCERIP